MIVLHTPHTTPLVLFPSQVDFDFIHGDNDPAPQRPLPCYEVAGFGHHRHDPYLEATCRLLDWPPVWATAIVDELLGVTETHLYETADEAREDAQDMAALLLHDQYRRRETVAREEIVKFDRLAAFEYIVYGPLNQDGAMTLAPQSCMPLFLENVKAFQARLAVKLLIVMERGLRPLPPSVRRRIYSYAATPRAIPVSAAGPPPDATQVQVHVMAGPDHHAPGLRSDWPLSMPHGATVNDAKRHVHAHLYDVNASMPEDMRLSADEMRHLHIHWGLCWQEDVRQHYWCELPVYVLGARPFSQLVEGFRLRSEEPRLLVYV